MNNAFIVLGTDGLWEKLTNEEVVGLVGKWIDRRESSTTNNSSKKGSSWFGGGRKGGEGFDVQNGDGGVGVGQMGAKKPPEKRGLKWVWQDGNAATHLIRNALGGGNLDEVRESVAPFVLILNDFVDNLLC